MIIYIVLITIVVLGILYFTLSYPDTELAYANKPKAKAAPAKVQSAAEKAAKAGDYSKAIKLYDEAIDQYHKLGDVKAEKAARIDQYGAKAMLNQNNSIKDIIVDTGN